MDCDTRPEHASSPGTRQVDSPTDITVVITTKNRIDCLPRAVESALAQHGNVEVLVIDDGSTDGTAEVIRQRFPAARVVRDEASRGYIVQRNRAAQLARGRILLSIDDDAVLTTPDLAGQVLAHFDHPRVGVVAIPVLHVNSRTEVEQLAPSGDGIWAYGLFIGTAYAVRRDVFLALGGFRELFFHQGEERDFALRLLAAGYIVRLAQTDRIDHFESPRRSFTRMDRYGRRNDILFTYFNAPLASLPGMLLRLTAAGLLHGFKVRRPLNMLIGLLMGYRDVIRYAGARRPVPSSVWSLFRRLRQPTQLEEIEPLLPAPAAVTVPS
ncbi:MAG: glycosyltransferase family 2 protein [Tepidisphaerales bacterium]